MGRLGLVRSWPPWRVRRTLGVTAGAGVLRMLDWPEDPAYDARALAHSGIDDPWAIGLLLPDTDDLAAHVVAVA